MATATTHPTHYRAALVVARDVIEWGGQPWRVVSGRTCPRTRVLALKHAHYPERTRTVRPRLGAPVRMLAPRGWW